MKIVFATNNAHKTEEVRELLDPRFVVVNPAQLGYVGEIPENGTTLEENACQKARFIYDKFRQACFADDTGLEVEALDGAPGVYSARYAGDGKNSENNIDKLLRELSGCDNRRARFRCVIAYIDAAGDEQLFEGVVNGEILAERQGDKGFGYDPVFRPDGYDCSFARMNLDDKNKISHRGRAVNLLNKKLLAL